jgi:putative methyltransferase (TIGR04325 family)
MLKRIIQKIPIISDYYHYHFHFPKNITACRGVYNSFSEAFYAIPKKLLAGYRQPIIEKHQCVPQLTARTEIGTFNSIDYPVLLWLKNAFTDSSKLFDLGGNVGLGYYAYKKFLPYPDNLRWLVCEIPEIAKAGKNIATEKGVNKLSFTTNMSEAEGADIFLSCGALQYLDQTLPELIELLQKKPRHLLIHNVPFYDGETFTTIQNIGYACCPYKVQNRSKFIDALALMCYELVDSWKIQHSFSIPFHPERHVHNYHGFYFQLTRNKVRSQNKLLEGALS